MPRKPRVVGLDREASRRVDRHIGARLRMLRGQRSLADVAPSWGTSTTQLSLVERGEIPAWPRLLLLASRTERVSPAFFFADLLQEPHEAGYADPAKTDLQAALRARDDLAETVRLMLICEHEGLNVIRLLGEILSDLRSVIRSRGTKAPEPD